MANDSGDQQRKKDSMMLPCQRNPDAWYGYEMQRGSRTASHQEKIDQAKLLCNTQCPVAELRRCAAEALRVRAKHGIWAGVELPGLKVQRGAALNAARQELEAKASEPTREKILRGQPARQVLLRESQSQIPEPQPVP